jgi:hypothetical protein
MADAGVRAVHDLNFVVLHRRSKEGIPEIIGGEKRQIQLGQVLILRRRSHRQQKLHQALTGEFEAAAAVLWG